MDMNLSKLREIVEDGEPGVLKSMGLQRVRHDLATEHHHQLDTKAVPQTQLWAKWCLELEEEQIM